MQTHKIPELKMFRLNVRKSGKVANIPLLPMTALLLKNFPKVTTLPLDDEIEMFHFYL